jgi:hypothetical protein
MRIQIERYGISCGADLKDDADQNSIAIAIKALLAELQRQAEKQQKDLQYEK